MIPLPILLRRYPLLFDRLNRLARRLGRRSAPYEAISRHLPKGEPFTFLQIGANDGISNDPFREFMIRREASGIAVEPVPEYFARLVRSYARYPQVRPENCAIGYPPGILPFYTYTPGYLARHGGSSELAGLAGFSRDHLLARLTLNEEPDQCIREIQIPVRTVEDVLARHGFASVDCLFLDCEGHEKNILKNLNYAAVKPRMIVFEHTHLGTEMVEILERLKNQRYALTQLEFDTLAVMAVA